MSSRAPERLFQAEPASILSSNTWQQLVERMLWPAVWHLRGGGGDLRRRKGLLSGMGGGN